MKLIFFFQLLLSAGHDGQLFLWDILTGEKISHFQNAIEGQGFGAIFDAKWSPNGTMMAATDSHGQILMYALSVSDSERQVQFILISMYNYPLYNYHNYVIITLHDTHYLSGV